MSAPNVPAPEGAFDYILTQLASGMSLARAASARLRVNHTETVAVVPTGARQEQLALFDRALGLSSGATVAQLASELASRFPTSRLILALPLARPSDPSLASVSGTVATCGNEAYLAVDLQVGISTVEQALRAHDPSFSYAVIVVDHAGGLLDICPTDALETGDYGLRAAGVGAYDGEGFIVAVA